MKNTQRGFIVPLLLVIIAFLLVGGGTYLYTQKKSVNEPVTGNATLPQASSTVQVSDSQTTTSTTQSSSSSNAEILAVANSLYKTDLKYNKANGMYSDAKTPDKWPNIETFVKLDNRYYEDSNSVYAPSNQSSTLTRLTYIDRATFALLTPNGGVGEWAKDRNYAYAWGYIVTEADVSTFNVIGRGDFATDKTHVFCNGDLSPSGPYIVIEGADSATFSSVSGQTGYDAQDKYQRYSSVNCSAVK